MAGMTPSEFFDGFVVENYRDWQDAPHSIRRAFNAAISAFHLADHYFGYYERRNEEFSKRYKKLENFQATLTSRVPSFRVIQDMATAYKHLYTRATCSVLSGGSIETLTFGKQKIEGDWREVDGKLSGNIVINLRDKSVIEFATAIDGVVEMWRDYVYSDEQPAL
jgi:hypothetical protein